MNKQVRLWTILSILAMVAPWVSAQAASMKELDIEADQMTMAFDRQQAVFSGNVTVRQKDLTLNCDTLTLQQSAQQSVQEITAIGQVYLRRGSDVASGRRATYLPAKQLLVMEGDVTLQRGNSTLRGETLRYNLADGTLKLQNGTGGERVRATLKPEDMTTKP